MQMQKKFQTEQWVNQYFLGNGHNVKIKGQKVKKSKWSAVHGSHVRLICPEIMKQLPFIDS